jgi:hypothetical protein
MPGSGWLLMGGLGGLVLFLIYKRIDKAWMAKMYAKIIRSETNSIRNAEIAKQNQEAIQQADQVQQAAQEKNQGLSLDEKFAKLKRPVRPK